MCLRVHADVATEFIIPEELLALANRRSWIYTEVYLQT